jgi:hypothetical protein
VSFVLHALDNDCLWLMCRGLMVVGDSAQECKVPTHVKVLVQHLQHPRVLVISHQTL